MKFGGNHRIIDAGDKMKLNRFQKILLWLIGISLSLSLILNVVSVTTPFSEISRQGYNVFSMLKYSLIDYPVTTVTDFFTSFSRLWQVRQENDLLRTQVDQISSLQGQLAEAERQIEELKQIADLKTIVSDYDLIPSTVLSRTQEAWNNLLTIDVGSADGVGLNYAVITPKGLVGKVTKVNEHTSTVKLITAEDGLNKVSVKIEIDEGKTVDAILVKYDSNEQAFVMQLLTSGATVTEEMRVVTSGMGGVFPSGLLVGTVSKVEELSNAVGMNIYVRPAADFQSFNYVCVVRRQGASQ